MDTKKPTLIRSFAGVVFVALLLRAFVAEAFHIPSGSMIPTLKVGDRIFVNKFCYGIRIPFTRQKIGSHLLRPHRGDLIVFTHPKELDKDLIKRVVAVAGDTVEVRNNALIVNHQPVVRHHLEGGCSYHDYDDIGERWLERRCDAYRETLDNIVYTTLYQPTGLHRSFGPVTVPGDRVFVMGDNRDNSSDSRIWGFVPLDFIKGRAMVVFWSMGKPEGIRFRRLLQLLE